MMLPWFEPEITPPVDRPGVHRYGLAADDAPGNVRAVVEAQQMAMALHSRWMGVPIDTIHATGGAAANRQILQVMADVFGAEVYRSEVANSRPSAPRCAPGTPIASPKGGRSRGMSSSRALPSRLRRAG